MAASYAARNVHPKNFLLDFLRLGKESDKQIQQELSRDVLGHHLTMMDIVRQCGDQIESWQRKASTAPAPSVTALIVTLIVVLIGCLIFGVAMGGYQYYLHRKMRLRGAGVVSYRNLSTQRRSGPPPPNNCNFNVTEAWNI